MKSIPRAGVVFSLIYCVGCSDSSQLSKQPTPRHNENAKPISQPQQPLLPQLPPPPKFEEVKQGPIPGSAYRRVGNRIFFGESDEMALLKPDLSTFRVFQNPSSNGIETSMCLDSRGFFFGNRRVLYKNAHRVRIIGWDGNGEETRLFVHNGELHEIDVQNSRVLTVPFPGNAAHLKSVETPDREYSSSYFVDATSVFYFNRSDKEYVALVEAKPATFRAHSESVDRIHWGTDGIQVYVGDKPIDGVDAPSFEYVGWMYARDKRRVYKIWTNEWSVVEGADPASFTVVKGRGVDARDKNHQYNRGRRLPPLN